MSLDDLGNIGEFAGAIGVILSLVYLAVQIRRNTRSVRASMYQAGVPVVPVREGTRHSSATAARREKWEMQLIQRMLGHSDVKMSERYSRFHEDALVELIKGK